MSTASHMEALGVFFFIPRDCAIDETTPYWLLFTIAMLAIAAIVLLAQVVMLWRRETAAGYSWWRRLPLALPVLVAALCGVLATQSWGFFRDVTGSTGDPFSAKGICFPVAEGFAAARFVVLVAAAVAIVCWFALARIARSTRSAQAS